MIQHDSKYCRFSGKLGGAECELEYRIVHGDTMDLYRTWVSPEGRGSGHAEQLVLTALEFARVVSIDDPLNLIPAAAALFDVLADLKDGLLAVAHHSDDLPAIAAAAARL